MLVIVCLMFFAFNSGASSNNGVTSIAENNVLLSRSKRYLKFPKGSNFVITFSLTKPLNRPQPRGYNALAECDVPFPLPEEPWKLLKPNVNRRVIHYRQKREILKQIQRALGSVGLDADYCLKRLICDARDFSQGNGTKSFLIHVIDAIFGQQDGDEEEGPNCEDNVIFKNCEQSVFNYMIGSFLS